MGGTCSMHDRKLNACKIVCLPIFYSWLCWNIHTGADKSLAFRIFLFAAQPKEFFLEGLKKLEQRSHKCVELRGEYVE
jgi:hypothetical protein